MKWTETQQKRGSRLASLARFARSLEETPIKYYGGFSPFPKYGVYYSFLI